MAVEIEEIPLKFLFLEKLQSGDGQELHAFLDNQNISDVAELIYEFPEHEGEILGNLSIHRAVSTFKILDFKCAHGPVNAQIPQNFTFMFRKFINEFRYIADILIIQKSVQFLTIAGLEFLQKQKLQRDFFNFYGHPSNLQRSLDKLHL